MIKARFETRFLDSKRGQKIENLGKGCRRTKEWKREFPGGPSG